MMKIGFFVPEEISPQPLCLARLQSATGKQFQYAVQGRYALYRIICSYWTTHTQLLVPAYFCPLVLDTIMTLHLPIQYYDIDLLDLNPSVESIQQKLERMPEDTIVIVPSFYGNAADLVAIEQVCTQMKAICVDDAAQSFGAKLDDRFLGTFGRAGMLAFSPGKATAGHMGALFWCDGTEDKRNRTRHPLFHYVKYWDYLWNRQNAYRHSCRFAGKLFHFGAKILAHLPYGNDIMEPFEDSLLGGFLWGNLENRFVRQKIRDSFAEEFSCEPRFRVIRNLRGQAHPCKIVLLFRDRNECSNMKEYLTKKQIGWFGGYHSYISDMRELPNTKYAVGRILELPIECNEQRMDELKYIIKEYCAKN